MYIDDTIDCILAMIKNKNVRNEVFDLCTGKPVAINSFVINIARILKRGEIKISHNGVSHENIMFVVSPKKAISLFGFKQKVTLEKGIIGLAKFLKK
jgi:nucleoside-diphosphate-sugar epimerase